MKTEYLWGWKIQTLEIDSEIFVPIKLFCDDYKINFINTMIEFNKLGLNINSKIENITSEGYLCFNVDDFIIFILVVSSTTPKLVKYRNAICKAATSKLALTKRKFLPNIKEYILNKYRIPNPDESYIFMLPTDVYNRLDTEIKEHTTIINVGKCLTGIGFKKKVKRVNGSARYGYKMVEL